MSDAGSYWDEPEVKAAEADYREGQREAEDAATYYLRKERAWQRLEAVRAQWVHDHPDAPRPWLGPMNENEDKGPFDG